MHCVIHIAYIRTMHKHIKIFFRRDEPQVPYWANMVGPCLKLMLFQNVGRQRMAGG